VISVEGRWFRDEQGRTVLLRGVNLGGSSKVPRRPDGATWRSEGFFDHRGVSFVGRPLPLEEADEHFTRLSRWGLTFLRFLVTWEAIEHAGPGIYDEEYLEYLRAVVEKAAEHGIQLFIDPHQDMWSRFSGGDGAPGWTFEAVGMDVRKFGATGAALTHQEHGDPLPPMIWPSNANRFACATMFTLFFGGNDFAPGVEVDGAPVQEFLQSHYINAIKQVALRLGDLPNVVGYDTLNEPLRGYIGSADLNDCVVGRVAQGETPTIFQGMLLAAGHPQRVRIRPRMGLPWSRSQRQLVNPQGVSLWMDGADPIWRRSGVWDMDAVGRPHILRPQHFCTVRGRPVIFDRDYFLPFVERYVREIRSVHPSALIFVDPQPTELAGQHRAHYAPAQQEGIVHAPHWYDGLTLAAKRYVPWLAVDTHGGKVRFVLGRSRRRRSFRQQVGRFVAASADMFGGVPTLIGETGIVFDLNEKEAYRSGDFAEHIAALDDTMQALEANLVSFTLWNYTADNSNERGDQWNDEDLSIFSRDQMTGTGSIDDGGRALQAVVRPHARAIPGEPLRLSFDIRTRLFGCEFRLDPSISEPAEFFVPALQYPSGYEVSVAHGEWRRCPEEQLLLFWPDWERAEHTVALRPR